MLKSIYMPCSYNMMPDTSLYRPVCVSSGNVLRKEASYFNGFCLPFQMYGFTRYFTQDYHNSQNGTQLGVYDNMANYIKSSAQRTYDQLHNTWVSVMPEFSCWMTIVYPEFCLPAFADLNTERVDYDMYDKAWLVPDD